MNWVVKLMIGLALMLLLQAKAIEQQQRISCILRHEVPIERCG